MRKTSADVLNDADRTQRIMDWVIFKTEQDARLWSGLEMEGNQWVPGDYLYLHPNWRENGEYPRPMFQIYDNDHSLATHDSHFFRPPRCDECLVSWYGDEPCWVCGQDIEGETFEKFEGKGNALGSMLRVQASYDPEPFARAMSQIRQDMSEHLDRVMRRTAESVGQLGDELRRIYVAFDNDLMVIVTSPARDVVMFDVEEFNSRIALGGARRALRGPQPPGLVVGSTLSLEGLRTAPVASRFWLDEVLADDLTLCPEGFEVPEAVATPAVPVIGTPFDGSLVGDRRYPGLERYWRRRDGDHGRR